MKEQVLAFLVSRLGEYVSGQEMSAALGVSRAAVSNAAAALRAEGCRIEAAPRRGYRLGAPPDRLTEGYVAPFLRSSERAARLICLDTVDSTNNYAKALALEGAADGTAVVAEEQTGGRGRQGRAFLSPRGRGVYLSVLLRPDRPAAETVRLTAFAAVAVCAAVEAVCGARPQIKWTNDILLGGKKLCGILTEMAVEAETGAAQYAVVGIGVNVSHTAEDFPPELRPVATSLCQQLGRPVDRARLCAALIDAVDDMYAAFRAGGGDYFIRYRDNCATLGRPVRLVRGDRAEDVFAEALGEDFCLLVRHPDGRRERVDAGEVSLTAAD